MSLLFHILRWIVLRFWLVALLVGVGWYGGAKYGAPDVLVRAADAVLSCFDSILEPLIGRGAGIAAEAVEQGGGYVVGTVVEMLEGIAEGEDASDDASDEAAEGEISETPADEPDEQPPEDVLAAAPDGAIVLCPRMSVRNAPAAKAGGVVRPAGAAVRLNGVRLLLMPATDACLSSGYGDRGGDLHRGVDYYTRTGGDVLAAGDGVIVEAVTRDDYGNMLVIDHGNGVYTRYAHLRSFVSGAREGASIAQGQVLGPIGMTGASSILHLHFEVLAGDINTNAGSFGLESVDPFTLPGA